MNEAVKPSFREGQLVVYPGRGLMQVRKIGSSKFLGREQAYTLVFKNKNLNGEITVPLKNEAVVGLRAISSPAEIRKALECLRGGKIEWPPEWRLRTEANYERIARGSIMDLAEALRIMNLVYGMRHIFGKEKEIYRLASRLFREEIEAAWGEEWAQKELLGILLEI
jgi:RNA polymerase-interacting CarD/CdnL/TRCF family regulator